MTFSDAKFLRFPAPGLRAKAAISAMSRWTPLSAITSSPGCICSTSPGSIRVGTFGPTTPRPGRCGRRSQRTLLSRSTSTRASEVGDAKQSESTDPFVWLPCLRCGQKSVAMTVRSVSLGLIESVAACVPQAASGAWACCVEPPQEWASSIPARSPAL